MAGSGDAASVGTTRAGPAAVLSETRDRGVCGAGVRPGSVSKGRAAGVIDGRGEGAGEDRSARTRRVRKRGPQAGNARIVRLARQMPALTRGSRSEYTPVRRVGCIRVDSAICRREIGPAG